MKVAIFGYGLIGKERVGALVRLREEEGFHTDFAVHDPFASEARATVESLGGIWCDSYGEIEAFKPDWVIIATHHDAAAQICAETLGWGARVLMEKPFGRSLAEAEQLVAAAHDEGRLFVGFNYRFFPGIAAAIGDAQKGVFGPLVSVSMQLGHGGAPGMEKNWKFDPVKAGGGCLIDPGIHLLDLCHCLSPNLTLDHLHAWKGFWNTGIEEEAHLMLHGDKTIFNVQVSVVRWRSTFRLELHGADGYGRVSGRGRSYGKMKYVRGRRWGWRDAANQEASEELVNASDCDDSFLDEMRALFSQTPQPWPAPCTGSQALEIMRTYEACKRLL